MCVSAAGPVTSLGNKAYEYMVDTKVSIPS